MNDGIRVREGAAADADRVAGILAAAWQAAYRDLVSAEVLRALPVDRWRHAWRARLEGGVPPTLVAEREGRIDGWIIPGPSRDETDAGDPAVGEIQGIYVDPAAWGTGVAEALWRAGLDRLRTDGFTRAVVWTFEANTRARRFYERMGAILDDGATKTEVRFGTRLPEVRYRLTH